MARRQAAHCVAVVALGVVVLQLAALGSAAADSTNPLLQMPRTATKAATPAPTADPMAGNLNDDLTGGTFSGVATADAYRVRVAVTDFLIVEDFVDGGGPSSQAALDSLGESTGFASFPYPGATGASLLGVLSTLTGKALPSYPFIVNSQYPSNPEAEVTQPGYRLYAKSTATSSESAANAGNEDTSGNQIGGFSKANVTQSTAGLVSHAEAVTHVKLNALTLSGAKAVAEVRRDAQGKVHKSSSLTITGLTIGGVPIGVTDRGLVIGSTAVPLNSLGTVTDTVTRDGMSVRFLPASQTENSQLSAGLEITSRQPVPSTSGTQITTITVGRAFARGDSSTFGTSFPINLPQVPSLPATVAPLALHSGTGVAVPPDTSPNGGVPPATIEAPAAQDPAVTHPGTTLVTLAGAARPRLSFYPILVLAGLVVLATSFGVRRTTRESV